MKKLSLSEQEEILEDFLSWSNGFTPDECSDEVLSAYVDLSLPLEIDPELSLSFLKSFIKLNDNPANDRILN